MTEIVFKNGDRISLDLDDGDPETIMQSTGIVVVESKQGEKLYIRTDDVMYIRGGDVIEHN